MKDVAVEWTETQVVVELVDIETTYYWLTAQQMLPEHRVVSDNDECEVQAR